jgi:hypothetical protein
MGYAADSDGGETLYVAESDFSMKSKGLARLDTSQFTLDFIGKFSPPIQRAELTGTGDGRLFAYSPNDPGAGSHIYEIDRHDAAVLADHPLEAGGGDFSYAFAFWGGVFYVFTGMSGSSEVTRWDPVGESESHFDTVDAVIVGAGVSTCAPL